MTSMGKDATAAIRKKHTGESGNPGEFGTRRRTEASVDLAAEAMHAEYKRDVLSGRLNGLNVAPGTVADVADGPGWQNVTLTEPHPTGGWDNAMFNSGDRATFWLGDLRHRLDGYAVIEPGEDPSGRDDIGEVWVDGFHRPDPAPELGLNFKGAVGLTGDRTLSWSSGNGSYEVQVTDGGVTSFYLDADLHRDGGPAVTTADGFEQWYNHGTEMLPPVPPAPHVERVGDDLGYTRHTGSKFTPGRELKAIGREIEKDLKRAQRLGLLPADAVFKVKTRDTAGDKHIQVSVDGLKPETVLNPGRDDEGQPWFTPEGQKAYDLLNRIGDSYNRWEDGESANVAAREFWLGTGFQTVGR